VSLEARLDELEQRLLDIEAEWARPEVASDPERSKSLGREQAQIGPIVENHRRLRSVRAEFEAARRDLHAESDPELKEMAREIIAESEAEETRLVEALRVQLLPRDPNDDRDVIIEIRGGTGGEEAAIFAADLYRMYSRYAERRRWKTEALSASESGTKGLREVIFEISGQGAYSRLKFEGGVHRVQRVDLRIDVKRASGPGGQSVNTTDSAVRITHLPTGLVVEIQDEKSQHKNKAKALSVLRARLLEQEQRKAREEEAEVRRSMVGSGERAEKIRTYNFPQDRITDHRIGMDVHGMPAVLDGELDKLIDALITTDQAERLASMETRPGTSA